MRITRAVVTDLLPAYLSGDVSNDTHVLVEEFLKNDAEFAREVERDWRRNVDLLGSVSPSLPAEPEKRAFERTRRYLRLRTLFLNLGIVFTLLPFSFGGGSGQGVEWLFWRTGFPLPVAIAITVASAAVALTGWVGLVLIGRRVRGTGL